jgi:hypothetical protein
MGELAAAPFRLQVGDKIIKHLVGRGNHTWGRRPRDGALG